MMEEHKFQLLSSLRLKLTNIDMNINVDTKNNRDPSQFTLI